jgi:hypothetical protein
MGKLGLHKQNVVFLEMMRNKKFQRYFVLFSGLLFLGGLLTNTLNMVGQISNAQPSDSVEAQSQPATRK